VTGLGSKITPGHSFGILEGAASEEGGTTSLEALSVSLSEESAGSSWNFSTHLPCQVAAPVRSASRQSGSSVCAINLESWERLSNG
jgi:hypothetical protein